MAVWQDGRIEGLRRRFQHRHRRRVGRSADRDADFQISEQFLGEPAPRAPGRGAAPGGNATGEDPAEDLGDTERVAWSSALDGYADFARRDLLFDTPLIAVNSTLAVLADVDIHGSADRGDSHAGGADLSGARMGPQGRINDAWIAAVRPLIDRHGAAMAEALERDWQPYLDGHRRFEDALSNLVQHSTRTVRE